MLLYSDVTKNFAYVPYSVSDNKLVIVADTNYVYPIVHHADNGAVQTFYTANGVFVFIDDGGSWAGISVMFSSFDIRRFGRCTFMRVNNGNIIVSDGGPAAIDLGPVRSVGCNGNGIYNMEFCNGHKMQFSLR